MLMDFKIKLKKAFDTLPQTLATDQASWYRLEDGTALKSLIKAIDYQRRNITLEPDEIEDMAKDLGLRDGVLRNDTYYGVAVIYPEIYADPVEPETFYMLCPHGINPRTAEKHQFEPEGGKELSEKQAQELTQRLFGCLPVLSKEPVTAYSPVTPK